MPTVSLPSRERGLKFCKQRNVVYCPAVAPFAGAWIEICDAYVYFKRRIVAPFAGAWIEMSVALTPLISTFVAPFAGAWIEILSYCEKDARNKGRSLRGSVD